MARWSSVGRRTSIRVPTPRPCVLPQPAKKLRWTTASLLGPRASGPARVILSAAKDLMPVASGDEVLRCAQDDRLEVYDFLSSVGVSVVSASACKPASNSS